MMTGARGYGQHGDVELLVPGGVGHVAGRHVRVPDEPDDQVGGKRQDDPDREQPQAVAGPCARLDLGLRRRHELTTSISPIM